MSWPALLMSVWAAAGILGLASGGVGRAATPASALADYVLAAALGPFSFLISYLACEAVEDDESSDPRS